MQLVVEKHLLVSWILLSIELPGQIDECPAAWPVHGHGDISQAAVGFNQPVLVFTLAKLYECADCFDQCMAVS